MEGLIVMMWLMVIAVTVVVLIAYYSAKGMKRKNDGGMQALASALGKTIVEVKLLGAGSTDHRSVGGAIVGGVVAGPLGAVVGGAQGGKGKQKQRFAVKYSDGSVEIKEVRTNSVEFKNLMKYVNWDDIK